jgi:retinol dehydrogenase 12
LFVLVAKLDWNDIEMDNNYHTFNAYSNSKLCNVLFTRELAHRLKGSNVTTYAVHPGVIMTEIDRSLVEIYGSKINVFKFLLKPFLWWFSKTTQQGAQTTIHCSLCPRLVNENGKYYEECKEKKITVTTVNDEDAKRLWELSEKMCNL